MPEQPGVPPPESQSLPLAAEESSAPAPEQSTTTALPRVEAMDEQDRHEPADRQDRPELTPTAVSDPEAIVLHAAQRIDIGRARDHQEDAAGIFVPGDPDTLARKGCLYLIADGMGGHNAGEIASHAAISEIERVYYTAPEDDVASALRRAIASANETILRISQANSQHTGLGTTAAVVIVRGREVHVANVGDSRVYLVRDGVALQITEDHSWVEEQVRAGLLTPEQARVHPRRHIITRALGGGPGIQPDLYAGVLQPRDGLVLNSDGLTGHVSDQEIGEIVGAYAPEQAAQRLVDLANERGGTDNISVIVVRAEAKATSHPVPLVARSNTPAGRRPLYIALGVMVTALLVLAALAFLLLRPTDRHQGSEEPPAAVSPMAAIAASPMVAISTTGTAAGETVASISTTGHLSPTATLRPTLVPSPTTEPTSTQRSAGEFLMPNATGTPTIAGTTTLTGKETELPAAQLVEPVDGVVINGERLVTFAWRWDGQLAPGQGFEVRIWREGSSEHLGAGEILTQPTDGRWQQAIRVGKAAGVEGRDGAYQWTVAMVQINPYQPVGEEAPARDLTYHSSSNLFGPLY